MPLSKPFAIATEGPTVDGRKISRDWLVQMAANYNPKAYTAVANLEHYLSSLPDSVFGAYGKVVSLSTRETDILGEKKLQLMAVVDANEDLIALQNKGKKAFPSMEVMPEFAQKPMAYLTGIAFTDKPASLGTETMKFSMAGTTVERYSFADEVAIEFESQEKPGESMFAKVMSLIGKGDKKADERFADLGKAVEAIAQSQKELLDKFTSIEPMTGELIEGKAVASAEDIKALQDAQKKFAADFAALTEKLAITDGDGKQRPAAAGGDGTVKTDC